MQTIQSSNAKTHLTQILREVESGESFSITRHGKVIARLIPEADFQRDELADLRRKFAAFRQGLKPMPLSDLIAARHEGHKY